MTDLDQLPPPTIRPTLPPPTPISPVDEPGEPAGKPLWRKKRVLLPALAIAALVVLAAVAPPPAETVDEDRVVDGESTAAVAPDAPGEPAPPPSAPLPTVVAAPAAPPPADPPPADQVQADLGGALTISNVVDGDTVDLSTGERVRILGYDTPERGECGYAESTQALTSLLAAGPVTLASDDGDDTDRYGRLLRHVLVGGVPVGLSMIETGNADARYDSLDGYPRHRYQDQYRAADGPNTFTCNAPAAAAPPPAPPAPAPAPPPVAAPAPIAPFENCSAARAAGAAPVLRGEPGYGPHLDRDDDGIGCE